MDTLVIYNYKDGEGGAMCQCGRILLSDGEGFDVDYTTDNVFLQCPDCWDSILCMHPDKESPSTCARKLTREEAVELHRGKVQRLEDAIKDYFQGAKFIYWSVNVMQITHLYSTEEGKCQKNSIPYREILPPEYCTRRAHERGVNVSRNQENLYYKSECQACGARNAATASSD